MRVGLPPYIQSKAFLYRAWQPPDFSLQVVVKGSKDRKTKSSSTETKNQRHSAKPESTDTQDIENIQEELVDIPAIYLHDQLDALEPTESKSDQVDVVSNLPDTPAAETPSEKTEELGEPQSLPTSKRPQKKKKKTEENIQWLGDKVSCMYTYILIDY